MPLLDPVSDVFFRERAERAPGERRSLDRARLLATELGVGLSDLHPLVVVGSKGKGTAAAYAAATLRAAGRSVGLVTSPGYRSHHERMRLDGVAISARDFGRLADRVERALASLPRHEPGSGYVSPTGAFTIAGLAWLVDRGCDAFVVEAGMGGASDESSLTAPSVVAITEIFEEHLGVLGDDLEQIAADKAGAISPGTQVVLSLPQQPVVRDLLQDAAGRAGARVTFVATDDADDEPQLAKLPTPLLRRNAQLGLQAGQAHLDLLDRADDGPRAEPSPFPDVVLPGRLSVHHRDGQTWVVDSAINPTGVRTALDWCRCALGEPSIVLLAIPTSKDLDACRRALDHPAVRCVRVDVPHLAFSNDDDPGRLPTLTDLDAADLGPLVLALGTISFVGDVLDLLDVDTTHLFRPPDPLVR